MPNMNTAIKDLHELLYNIYKIEIKDDNEEDEDKETCYVYVQIQDERRLEDGNGNPFYNIHGRLYTMLSPSCDNTKGFLIDNYNDFQKLENPKGLNLSDVETIAGDYLLIEFWYQSQIYKIESTCESIIQDIEITGTWSVTSLVNKIFKRNKTK